MVNSIHVSSMPIICWISPKNSKLDSLSSFFMVHSKVFNTPRGYYIPYPPRVYSVIKMTFIRDSKPDEEISIAALIVSAVALAHVFIQEADALLLSISFALSVLPVLTGTIRNAVNGRAVAPGIISFASIAVAVAFGEYVAAAEIAFIAGVCITAYKWAINRAHAGVREIVEMIPSEVRKVTDDGYESVPTTEVSAGDVLHINTGECIPFDGIIVKGSVFSDSTNLDGITEPQFRKEGDSVLGGTRNVFGFFDLEVSTVEKAVIFRMPRILRKIDTLGSRVTRQADRLSTAAFGFSAAAAGLVCVFAGPVPAVATFATVASVMTVLGIESMHATGKLDPTNVESKFMHHSKKTCKQTF